MKTKFGIVGCGFLGNIVADAWKKGLLEDYELVGVTSRTFASASLRFTVRTAAESVGHVCGSATPSIKPCASAAPASIQVVAVIIAASVPRSMGLRRE